MEERQREELEEKAKRWGDVEVKRRHVLKKEMAKEEMGRWGRKGE